MIDLEDIDFETFSNWHPAVQIVAMILMFLILIPILFGIFSTLIVGVIGSMVWVGVGMIYFILVEIIENWKLKKDIDNVKQ